MHPTARDIVPIGDTRRWAGRGETDLTKFVRAQNQLLFDGAIPACRVHAVLARM